MLTLNLNAWLSSQGGLASKDLENMCFILRLEVVHIADPDNFKSKCLEWFADSVDWLVVVWADNFGKTAQL